MCWAERLFGVWPMVYLGFGQCGVGAFRLAHVLGGTLVWGLANGVFGLWPMWGWGVPPGTCAGRNACLGFGQWCIWALANVGLGRSAWHMCWAERLFGVWPMVYLGFGQCGV